MDLDLGDPKRPDPDLQHKTPYLLIHIRLYLYTQKIRNGIWKEIVEKIEKE